MENPRFKLQSEIVKMTVADLISGKEMAKEEMTILFNTAINQSLILIQAKSSEIYGYESKDNETKRHLAAVVLDRILSLRPMGGTTANFTGLKDEVCEQMGIKNTEELSDERFQTVLSRSLDDYFDRDIPINVNSNMNFIRTAVDKIIPSSASGSV